MTKYRESLRLKGLGFSERNIALSVAGLQEMAGGGTICIPVYVGGTLLDEVVVDAQARQNLRSGGR